MEPTRRFITLPFSARGVFRASPFTRRLAVPSRRIVFVILRTGHSPSVALHPASLRRRYGRLQAGEGLPEEDLHLSGKMRLQAHIGVGRAWLTPPLPPNRTGGSPAYGSPVDGLPTRGLMNLSMGRYKAKQPLLVKVSVWPTPMA